MLGLVPEGAPDARKETGMSRGTLFLIAILATLGGSIAAQTTWNVPSLVAPDLASAVALAANGDTIVLAAGHHSSAGLVAPIGKALEIKGAGPNLTFVHGDDANPQAAVLAFQGGAGPITLRKLTIQPTSGGGLPLALGDRRGLHVQSGSTTPVLLDRIAVQDCRADRGAGLYCNDAVALTMTNCKFIGNESTGNVEGGGAMNVHNVQADDCEFQGNLASNLGGAVYLRSGQVGIRTSRFEQNDAIVGGGAVAGASYGDITFARCRFLDNQAQDGGVFHLRPAFKPLPAPGGVVGAYPIAELCYFRRNAGQGSARLFDLECRGFLLWNCSVHDNQGNPNSPMARVLATDANAGFIQIQDSLFHDAQDTHMVLSAYKTPPALPFQDTSSIRLTNVLLPDFPTTNTPNFLINRVSSLYPAFAEIRPDSYRLAPGSPAVDAAFGFPGTPDIDGRPRPVGAGHDIGCFELQDQDPGPAFAGTTSYANVMLFDGTNGGTKRSVSLDANTICTLFIGPPVPGQVAPFILWGYLGVPLENQAFPIPFANGSMAFTPQVVDPGNPLLFVMADNILDPNSAVLPSVPAPWAISGPSLPYALSITIQGLIADGSGPLQITNAITIHTRL